MFSRSRVVSAFLAALVSVPLSATTPAQLKAGFANPPNDAKVHTWWHWMNGNVTKAGITADLEAMARVGVGGAQIFDVGCGVPTGDVKFNSPEWLDMIKHAAGEARRLGIELCLPNCSGWTSSGGPWITPELAMKRLSWTTTNVSGPTSFCGKLENAKGPYGFYEDIAVVAVKVPEADKVKMSDFGAVVKNEGASITVMFPKPYAAAGFRALLKHNWIWGGSTDLTIETSDDGEMWKMVEKQFLLLAAMASTYHGERFVPFRKKLCAKAFRVTFKPQGHVTGFKIAEFELKKGLMIPDLNSKNYASRMPIREVTAETDPEQVVAKDDVIDLTPRLKGEGALEWNVPPGDWRILRLGYTCVNRKNAPASKYGCGLEVDKLSAEAVDFHFESYVGKICRHLGDLAGNVKSGLNNVLIDSYEVGSQNWTKGLEVEFERRMGYSPAKYYPVLTGLVVGSLDEGERFLADFRRVVSDLFAQNYAGEMAKKCHAYGLQFSLEPYGDCPTDDLQYGQTADIPMAEFWSACNFGRRGTKNTHFAARGRSSRRSRRG